MSTFQDLTVSVRIVAFFYGAALMDSDPLRAPLAHQTLPR